MKKVFLGAAIVAAGLLSVTSARAASFTTEFCPDPEDTCLDSGTTSATLTFDEILTGTDPNDYDVYLTIVSDGTAWTWINAVQFKLDGYDTPGDFEALPELVSVPAGSGNCTENWGTIQQCTVDNFAGESVCAVTDGDGAATADGTNTWQWLLDFDDDADPLGVGSSVLLRAQFSRLHNGKLQVGNNLSPGSTTLDTSFPETSQETTFPETSNVPEPALMSLLGLGLVAVARQVRRRG